MNIPLRVRHLGGSAGTSLNRWACSVAIFSRAAAVSRGVHPFASEAVTKAANAASKATSQLTSRSGLPFGNMGGCTAWDMHTKWLADERFPRFEPFTFEGRLPGAVPLSLLALSSGMNVKNTRRRSRPSALHLSSQTARPDHDASIRDLIRACRSALGRRSSARSRRDSGGMAPDWHGPEKERAQKGPNFSFSRLS